MAVEKGLVLVEFDFSHGCSHVIVIVIKKNEFWLYKILLWLFLLKIDNYIIYVGLGDKVLISIFGYELLTCISIEILINFLRSGKFVLTLHWFIRRINKLD